MKCVPDVLFLGVLAVAACGQEPAPPDPRQGLLERFKDGGITVDPQAGSVAVTAVVNRPMDPIEFLLIHRRGKTHEAMFYTLVKPSLINGALLLIGYQPGKNVGYREADPLPTREEVALGAQWVEVFPPQGMELFMTVRWEVDGVTRELPVEDLIYDLTTGTEVTGMSFVYLGGRLGSINVGEPEVFMADYEGNLVSTIYRTPENHLGTMVHERATDQENWWMTERCPEAGTEVQFVFHNKKTALHRAREKRLQAGDILGSKIGRDPSGGPGPASQGVDVPDPDKKGEKGKKGGG